MNYGGITPGHFDSYTKAYKIYKNLEVASPMAELAFALYAFAVISLDKKGDQVPSYVTRILKILLASDLTIACVLLWQTFDPAIHS